MMEQKKQSDNALKKWRETEKRVLELLEVVGRLRLDSAVDLIFFKQNIFDSRPSEIIQAHLRAKDYVSYPITIDMSLSLAHSIEKLNLSPARIDIGKLALNWMSEDSDYTADLDLFVRKELNKCTAPDQKELHSKDVVLFGFGRIGRLITRRIISLTGRGEQLRLRAIVVKQRLKDRGVELEKRASLLRNDSIHGDFRGIVDIDAEAEQIIINGNRIQVIFADSLEEVNYEEHGINDALLIDNSGLRRSKEDLEQHFRPGIEKVLLTAHAKDVPNIIHGVNNEEVNIDEQHIISAASCTTNAIVPILKVINDKLKITKGHIESLHAYTNSQNLLDNIHKYDRRGRAAALNMVLTTTRAAKAATKVLPELEGKLTGHAIRVPTPNVSLAILHLDVETSGTVAEVNNIIRQASLYGDLVDQIKYSTNTDYVSNDVNGTEHPAVFDAPSTIVSQDGKQISLYVWYDNEYGYSCQVVRLATYISKVRRLRYY